MRTQLYLTPKDRGRKLSLEEFQTAETQEGFHYELIHGRLEVSPLPNLPHDRLRKWLERLLDDYTEAHPEVINWVQAPARVFLPDGSEVTAPEPDLAAYRNFPVDAPLAETQWQDVSPVLVAEVLSEGTEEKDEVRNRDLFIQVPSILEYWILDPRLSAGRPSLTVFRRRDRKRWRKPVMVAGGSTYATPLLPGFTLTLVAGA